MAPAELQSLLDQIDACERDARALVAGLAHGQINWQPEGGRAWSVGQCLDHLAKINVFYLAGLLAKGDAAKRAGRGPFAGLRPTALGRWFLSSLEPPPRRKVRSPRQVVPGSEMTSADVLSRYVESHAPYRALIDASRDIDVNRIRVGNPFFRLVPMRLSTILLALPAHDRRHLWQAKIVTEKRDFPR